MLLIYFFYYVFRRLYAKTSDLILEMFFIFKTKRADVVMTLALLFFLIFLASLKYLLYLCIRITLVFPNGPCEGPQETLGLFLFECYVECFPSIFPYFCFQLPDFAVNMYLVLIVTSGASFSLLLYILDVFFGCHILYFS